ncbi:MAG: phosphate/phosphite/phosphonate ABC transporter substrate-binding protein, partial [Myxococcales bacterium]|nr:phosphate/phosphite/phosphonate ABC transporter substrate-binding protein [Myxococcales bacterium]
MEKPPPLRFAVSRSNGGPTLLDGARQFAAALGTRLATTVQVVVSYDYAALLKATITGNVELAWMPPLVHARAAAQGGRLVALSQRGGSLGYRSAILVGNDRYRTVRDLVGVRAAWVDPSSASGYIFPRLHLLAAAADRAALFASERFCGSATNACRLVMAGEADLAACFLSVGSDRESAQREIARMFNSGSALRVLDVTAKIPSDGFAIAPTVDETRANALRSALLT